MASAFETFTNERLALSSEPDLGERLANEAYVLIGGTVGGFGKLKDAAAHAVQAPGETAFKVLSAGVLGGALGFFAQKAGMAGLLARGAACAFGAAFVYSGIKPFGEAMSSAWDARSNRQLNAASEKLSGSVGQIMFDTALLTPFAMTGAFAGRGLRSVFSPATTAEATAAPRTNAASETQRRHDQSAGRPFQPQPSFRATSSRPSQARAERSAGQRVLEGEILEAEIVDTGARAARKSPVVEIIDAEFTVIETDLKALPGSMLPVLKAAGDAPVVIVKQAGANQFSVALRGDFAPAAARALGELRRWEPAWSMESGMLVSPGRSRMSPEQIARILKNAYNPAEHRLGQIVDVKA